MKYFIFIVLFTILSFSQNNDYYLKNKIERKVHPLAWQSYDINETLELLYGKDRVYKTSEDIKIKMPTSSDMYATSSGYPKITIDPNKKVKSIAILHKKEGERALMTLFYPYNDLKKIQLPLKMLNIQLNREIKGMKIVVITETEDNHLFINTYGIYYYYFCIGGMAYNINHYVEELKEELNNNRLKTKYQVKDDGGGHLKFKIFHPMVSYIEGEKLNSKVNFISHIRGKIKNRKLFDLYTSEYISKSPTIKMGFQNMKQNENISLSYSTINGEVTSKEVVVRRKSPKKN